MSFSCIGVDANIPSLYTYISVDANKPHLVMSLIMSSMNNMMLPGIFFFFFFCSWSCSTALWQSEVMALGWTVSDPPELPRPPLLTHLVAHLPLNYHHEYLQVLSSSPHRVLHLFLPEVHITGSRRFFFSLLSSPSCIFLFSFSFLSPCIKKSILYERKKRRVKCQWAINQ